MRRPLLTMSGKSRVAIRRALLAIALLGVAVCGLALAPHLIVPPVAAQDTSDDDLSDLQVDGVSVAEFDAGTRSYQFVVANWVTQVTVTGVAVDAAATVTYSGTDVDGVADGHQVDLSVGANVVTVTVTAEGSATTRNYTLTVTRAEPSADLSALSVGGVSVAGFNAGTTSYQFGVANTVSRATVAGVPFDASATVAYSGTDADGGTDGHQMNLSVGRNLVTVTVTATDGDTRDYTVSVNRGSDAPFGWKAEDDFDTLKAAGNIRARGIWSDGTTMWVGDDGPNKLFAYTLASRQRNPDEDFNTLHDARNRSIRGLWSDGTTMWVGDYNDNRIFAYARTTKQRDEDSDFIRLVDTEPRWSWGIWSDRTTMWIADPVFDGIYAYEQVGRERDADKDIIPVQRDGNVRSADLWSDGTTMWVSDSSANKLYAYALDTGQRDSVRDFDVDDLRAAGNDSAGGIWSNGTTMWVQDERDAKLYAYNMPGNPDLSALSLSAGILTPTLTPNFHRVTTSYAVSVENSVSTITVTATADDADDATVEFLDADDMPLADADSVTDGQQVNLVVGDKTIKVKVTADDGVVTRTYTMTVTREAPSTDLSALSVGGKSVAGFDAETTSYQFGVAQHGDTGDRCRRRLRRQRHSDLQRYGRQQRDRRTPGGSERGLQRRDRDRHRPGRRQDEGLHRQRQPGVGRSLRLEGRGRLGHPEGSREHLPHGHLVRRHDHVGVGRRGQRALRLHAGQRAARLRQGLRHLARRREPQPQGPLVRRHDHVGGGLDRREDLRLRANRRGAGPRQRRQQPSGARERQGRGHLVRRHDRVGRGRLVHHDLRLRAGQRAVGLRQGHQQPGGRERQRLGPLVRRHDHVGGGLVR